MGWFDDNNPERPERGGATTTTAAPLPPSPGTLPNGAPLPQNGSVIFNPNAPGVTQTGPSTYTQPAIGAGFSSTGPADGDWQKWFQTLVAGRPSSYALIKQLEPQLNAAGIQVNTNLEGDPSKLILPNGHYISAVDQNGAWRWQDQGTPADNAANTGASGDLLQPFTEQLQLDPFTAPTGVDETNDPGYKARLDILQDARQRQAAAQGNLLSGSTSEALDKQASDYGSQEYGNVYNRAYQTWQGNQQQKLAGYNAREQTFYANQNNPFAKLYAMSSLDSQNQNALNQLNLGYAGLGAGTITGGANQYASLLTQGGNATAAGQVGAGNAYAGALGQASQLPFQYAAYNSIFNKPPATTGYPGWPGSQGGG